LWICHCCRAWPWRRCWRCRAGNSMPATCCQLVARRLATLETAIWYLLCFLRKSGSLGPGAAPPRPKRRRAGLEVWEQVRPANALRGLAQPSDDA
jgi:hypothetical protein